MNDPYEGELFTWWLYFFGGLSQTDKNLLWEAKRPQLVSVEYNVGEVEPITVQKGKINHREYRLRLIIRVGYWFSAHEQWKVMEMPYYDVDLVK